MTTPGSVTATAAAVGRFVARLSRSIWVSFAKPKSRILTRPSFGDEEVLGLQIPMDDPLLVRRREALRDLKSEVDRLARRESARGELGPKSFAFEQLLDDIGSALVRTDVDRPP